MTESTAELAVRRLDMAGRRLLVALAAHEPPIRATRRGIDDLEFDQATYWPLPQGPPTVREVAGLGSLVEVFADDDAITIGLSTLGRAVAQILVR